MPRPTIKVEISSVEAKRGAREVQRELNRIIKKVRSLEAALERQARTTSVSMVRQKRAINSAREQLLNFQQAVRLAGASSTLIARTTRSFKALERTMKSGKLTAREFAEAQDRFRAALGRAKRALRDFKAQQEGVNKEIDQAETKVGRLTGIIKNLGSATIFAVGPLSGIGARLAAFGAIASRTSPKFALVAAGIAGVAVAAKKMADAMVNARKQADTILFTLRAVTGDLTKARREFEFVANASERLGLDIQSTALQYAQLSAAAKSTTLTGETVKNIFLAISRAGVAMGLTADQIRGALLAVQQMMSKGTVQAEELRGQLGERLPGAFNLAAEAMGVTTQQLNKLLQQGKVAAEDLLPRLADVLNTKFGSAAVAASSSLTAELNKLSDATFRFSERLDTLLGFSDAVTFVLRTVRKSVDALRGSLERVGKPTDVLKGKLRALRGALDELREAKRTGNTLARTLIETFVGSEQELEADIAKLRRKLEKFFPQKGIQTARVPVSLPGFLERQAAKEAALRATSAVPQPPGVTGIRLREPFVPGLPRRSANAPLLREPFSPSFNLELANRRLKAVSQTMELQNKLRDEALQKERDLIQALLRFAELKKENNRQAEISVSLTDEELKRANALLRMEREARGRAFRATAAAPQPPGFVGVRLREPVVPSFDVETANARLEAGRELLKVLAETASVQGEGIQNARIGLSLTEAQLQRANERLELLRQINAERLQAQLRSAELQGEGIQQSRVGMDLSRASLAFANKRLQVLAEQRKAVEGLIRSRQNDLQVLRARLDGGRQAATLERTILRLKEEGITLTATQIELIRTQIQERDKLLRKIEEQTRREQEAESAARSLASSLTRGLRSATSSAEGLRGALRGVLDMIIDIILQQTVQKPLEGFFGKLFSAGGTLGSFFGFGGGSAAASAGPTIAAQALRGVQGGGHVSAGETVIVGEAGPEIFTPRVSGTILPNEIFQAGGGIVINQNFDFRGASLEAVSLLRTNAERIKQETIAEIERRKARGFNARR